MPLVLRWHILVNLKPGPFAMTYKEYCIGLFVLFNFSFTDLIFGWGLKFVDFGLGSCTQSIGLTEVLQWQYVALQCNGLGSNPSFRPLRLCS